MSTECDICLEHIYPVESLYICSQTGRLDKSKPHPDYHESCMRTWAQTKDDARNIKVECSFPGCNTNISHLLPKKSFFRQSADFLTREPAVRILAAALPLLGIRAAAVAAGAAAGAAGAAAGAAAVAVAAAGAAAGAGAAGAAGAAAGAVAVAAAAAGAGAVAAAVAAVAAGAVAAAVAAVAAVAAGAAAGAVEGEVAAGAGVVAVAAGAVAGAVAGVAVAVAAAAPRGRDFLKAGAAAAGLVGLSVLVNGGGLALAGGMASLSALGTWAFRRFVAN